MRYFWIYLLTPSFNPVYMFILVKNSLKNFQNKSKWLQDNRFVFFLFVCFFTEWIMCDIKLLVNFLLEFFEGVFKA